jgi:hypothetical protein
MNYTPSAIHTQWAPCPSFENTTAIVFCNLFFFNLDPLNVLH